MIAFEFVNGISCFSCTERSTCDAGSADVGWLDSRCPHVIESHPARLHVDHYSNTSVWVSSIFIHWWL